MHGPPPVTVVARCRYDRNGDGSLTKEEIELLIHTAVKNGFRATLHKNDKVGAPAEHSVQEQLTEQLADELAQNLATQLAAPFLAMLDKNADGAISLEEFKAAKGAQNSFCVLCKGLAE